MPRQPFTDLPLADLARCFTGRGVVADINRICELGYDPEPYPLPILTQYNALAASLGKDTATNWARPYFEALAEEQRAAKLIDARRHWAATTSLEDDQKAAAARRDAEAKAARDHEKAVAARAKALLAADEADRTARARRRAEQEISR